MIVIKAVTIDFQKSLASSFLFILFPLDFLFLNVIFLFLYDSFWFAIWIFALRLILHFISAFVIWDMAFPLIFSFLNFFHPFFNLFHVVAFLSIAPSCFPISVVLEKDLFIFFLLHCWIQIFNIILQLLRPSWQKKLHAFECNIFFFKFWTEEHHHIRKSKTNWRTVRRSIYIYCEKVC